MNKHNNGTLANANRAHTEHRTPGWAMDANKLIDFHLVKAVMLEAKLNRTGHVLKDILYGKIDL